MRDADSANAEWCCGFISEDACEHLNMIYLEKAFALCEKIDLVTEEVNSGVTERVNSGGRLRRSTLQSLRRLTQESLIMSRGVGKLTRSLRRTTQDSLKSYSTGQLRSHFKGQEVWEN